MNAFSRIIAGAGFGGPLGALVARALRYLPVRGLAPRDRPAAADPRDSVAFTIAVIALGAKMAKADGTVSRDEVAAFREVFQVPPEEEAHLRLVFDLARRSTAGFDSYARQVGRLFAGRRAVLEDLLGGLFYIALADGRLCPAEEAYLREVARHFGIDAAGYARLRASFVGPASGDDATDDPHAVLGVAPDASLEEIRAAYRRLIRTYHPDLLIGRGLPAERLAAANQRLARINAARDRLVGLRSGRGGAAPEMQPA
jgi:DnaJ like chaperone protein